MYRRVYELYRAGVGRTHVFESSKLAWSAFDIGRGAYGAYELRPLGSRCRLMVRVQREYY